MVKFLSYSTCTVVPYSRDRYEIIGLLNISHSIKQPCSSVCLKKALEMHQKCLNNAVPLLTKMKNRKILIYSKLLKCHTSPKIRLPTCM